MTAFPGRRLPDPTGGLLGPRLTWPHLQSQEPRVPPPPPSPLPSHGSALAWPPPHPACFAVLTPQCSGTLPVPQVWPPRVRGRGRWVRLLSLTAAALCNDSAQTSSAAALSVLETQARSLEHFWGKGFSSLNDPVHLTCLHLSPLHSPASHGQPAGAPAPVTGTRCPPPKAPPCPKLHCHSGAPPSPAPAVLCPTTCTAGV